MSYLALFELFNPLETFYLATNVSLMHAYIELL